MTTLLLVSTLLIGGLISFYYLYKMAQNNLGLAVKFTRAEETILLQAEEINSLKEQLINANTDNLTKLPGWQVFLDRLNQKLKESSRLPTQLAILIVDLNFFHLFNQRYGATSAEWLLTEAASRITNCLRKVDSATRLSNQRFIILLAKINNKEGAAIVAERLLNNLSQPFTFQEEEVILNAQVGISLFPEDGSDSITLLSKAEQALQISQQKGGQAFQFYTESHPSSQQWLIDIAAGWLQEIKLTELKVSFHPVYDMQQNNFLSMQARVEWIHPQIGAVDELTLFRIGDQQSRSMLVSEWLLKKTCEQYNALFANQGSVPACFSIPITIRQFKNYHFIIHLLQILKNANVDPKKLVLEVITDVTINDEDVIKSIELLQSFHVKLAIRDFGAQPFAIAQIKNWGVNYVMLSPVFSHHIENDSQAQAILKALINLANGLAVLPIVEKNESEERNILMQSLGCRYFAMQEPMKVLSS